MSSYPDYFPADMSSNPDYFSADMSSNPDFFPADMSGSDNPQQLQWHKENRFVLLEEYAKHKKEFLCPDVDADRIWEEIAAQVKRKAGLTCSAADCCQEIEGLKIKYERNKNKVVTISKIALFVCHAKYAFEIDESSVVPPDLQTSSSLFQINGDKPNNIPLIEAYAKYKAELLTPGVDEMSVWKKIADEVKKKEYHFTEAECRDKIEELRCEYERIKSNGFLLSRRMAMYMDNARRVFETQDDIRSTESNNKLKGPKNEVYNRTLLQTYIKYKSENTSADDEVPEVWEKIAKEMKEVHSFNCGKSLCHFDLIKMKWQYENFKSRHKKSGFMPYLLDEAQKAFGNPEATYKKIEAGKCTNKYIFPYSNKKRKQKNKKQNPNKKMKMSGNRGRGMRPHRGNFGGGMRQESGNYGGGMSSNHGGGYAQDYGYGQNYGYSQNYGYGGGPSEQWF